MPRIRPVKAEAAAHGPRSDDADPHRTPLLQCGTGLSVSRLGQAEDGRERQERPENRHNAYSLSTHDSVLRGIAPPFS